MHTALLLGQHLEVMRAPLQATTIQQSYQEGNCRKRQQRQGSDSHRSLNQKRGQRQARNHHLAECKTLRPFWGNSLLWLATTSPNSPFRSPAAQCGNCLGSKEVLGGSGGGKRKLLTLCPGGRMDGWEARLSNHHGSQQSEHPLHSSTTGIWWHLHAL